MHDEILNILNKLENIETINTINDKEKNDIKNIFKDIYLTIKKWIFVTLEKEIKEWWYWIN